MTESLDNMNRYLDDAKALYEQLREAENVGIEGEIRLFRALLSNEIIRATAVTGEHINLCPCGDVYFQREGCLCDDWIKDADDAYANTMQELDLPYEPPSLRVNPSKANNVIDMFGWLATHGSRT